MMHVCSIISLSFSNVPYCSSRNGLPSFKNRNSVHQIFRWDSTPAGSMQSKAIHLNTKMRVNLASSQYPQKNQKQLLKTFKWIAEDCFQLLVMRRFSFYLEHVLGFLKSRPPHYITGTDSWAQGFHERNSVVKHKP